MSLQKAAPTLSPNIAGKWVQKNPTTLNYALYSPLIPSSQMEVTIPGGSHGLRSTQGATLPSFQPQDDVRVCLDPAGHPFCLYLG